MDFLKKYQLSDTDIKDISSKISLKDQTELITSEEKIDEIINYFLSIGITNIKDLFLYKSSLFYDSVESIKRRLSNCTKEMIDAINDDVLCLDLMGI